jgi:hypothetical protein
MSVMRIARWGLGALLAATPLSASAAPVVTGLDSTEGLTPVRYDNCRWRNGHRVCVRTDDDGNSLVGERYMRPRDFRERENDSEFFFNNSRQQGGTRIQGGGQGSGRYQ